MKAENFSRYLLKIALLFVIYFTTAKLGLSLNAVSGFAAPVWPSTGIALAAILILGYRFWPGIALGAFLINFTTGAPLFVAAGVAVGNTLEAVLGAYLLKRFIKFQNALERVKDVVGLVILAGLVATSVSATIGVTSLLLGHVITSSLIAETWLAWWVGDALGALVIAPLILVWNIRPRTRLQTRGIVEGMVLAALLIFVSMMAFRGFAWLNFSPSPFIYIVFPALIWIALRFGQRGSVMAMFTVSVIAIWNTVAGYDLFAATNLSQSLILLQSFLGVSAVTFMTMAAVVAEREQTQKTQHEMERKTAKLTKQHSRLVALNQAKDEFLALASHQLRTPATGVKQYIGMLQANYAGKLTKHQRAILRTANENNERQIQVIDDLLNVAQIDTGKVVLRLEDIDLLTLVKDIIKSQLSTLNSRDQVVKIMPGSGSFVASVDRRKLRMALENIVDNASKYSPDGQQIIIKLDKTRKGLTVSVKDSGIGIAPKDMGKLFKKFSRVDNSLSAVIGGNGLGLYWAKRVVELHHGSIDVTSKPNIGSTFTVTLPAAKKSQ